MQQISAAAQKSRLLHGCIPCLLFHPLLARVGRHSSAFGLPPNLQPRESEIVDAVLQSEKSIRGEPVSSCKLRYLNSLDFFDHPASTNLLSDWTQAMTCSHCPTYPALLTVDEDALYTEHTVKRKNQGLRVQ